MNAWTMIFQMIQMAGYHTYAQSMFVISKQKMPPATKHNLWPMFVMSKHA
jgi:hypothetical protein